MSDTDSKNAAAYLACIDAFRSLSRDALDDVGRACRWHRFERGAHVLHHLDKSRDVYLIAEGTVRATIFSTLGREISYQDLSSGSIFGELSAIDGEPRTTHVITLEPSVIGTLSETDFWQAVKAYPEVAEALLKRLAGLVRFLCNRVYEYGALDVKDRVRVDILRLARQCMKTDNRAVIVHMPTHSEIANRISTHREAVTRELNDLARQGLIEKSGRTVTVPDVTRLAALLPRELDLG